MAWRSNLALLLFLYIKFYWNTAACFHSFTCSLWLPAQSPCWTQSTDAKLKDVSEVPTTNLASLRSTFLPQSSEETLEKFPPNARLTMPPPDLNPFNSRHGNNCKIGKKDLLGWWECSKTGRWRWLHNFVDLLKITGLHTYMGKFYEMYINT